MPHSTASSSISRDSPAARANAMLQFSNQIQYRMLQVANLGQPAITIELDNGAGRGMPESYVTSYSTMDTIEGKATIVAQHDMRFEDVQIAFVGTSQVYIDRLSSTPSMSGRTEAAHRFLTLKQPIHESDLPSPRILRAGQKYSFPFFFTVPAQLLPRACSHPVAADHVRDTHLMLPPSLGDPELSGFGGSLLDDLAPDMSKITYGIKVRVTQAQDGGGKMAVLAEKLRKVRVKPAFEEQPPLNLDHNAEFRARQEKSIKKGLLKGKKLGTLTAEAMQPKALVIPGARSTSEGNEVISTRARVVLRFDPAVDGQQPPKLGALKTAIRVNTYYAAAPRSSLPSRDNIGYDVTMGMYCHNINLSTMCVGSLTWTPRAASESPEPGNGDSTLHRRDSGMSGTSNSEDAPSASHADGIPQPSKDYRPGTSFYTASILVPITLPTNKNFLPTFHSCLISRTYSLSLTLSAQHVASVHLKVPVQIRALGSEAGERNARQRRSEVQASIMPLAVAARTGSGSGSVAQDEDDEVGRIFAPRRLTVPEVVTAPEREAPPEYAMFAGTVGRYGARVTAVG